MTPKRRFKSAEYNYSFLAAHEYEQTATKKKKKLNHCAELKKSTHTSLKIL